MYLVDTDVLSDARQRPGAARAWLRSIDPTLVHVSVITLGEVRKGFELKARKDPLGAEPLLEWLNDIRREYRTRIVPVDDDIALEWGRLEAQRPRGSDGLIAATARVRDMVLVTRNARDFADIPIRLVNPFEALPEARP